MEPPTFAFELARLTKALAAAVGGSPLSADVISISEGHVRVSVEVDVAGFDLVVETAPNADGAEAVAQFRAILRADAAAAVEDEREACAKICEAMVIVGRAWTEEQAAAASALLAAAKAIRERGPVVGGSHGVTVPDLDARGRAMLDDLRATVGRVHPETPIIYTAAQLATLVSIIDRAERGPGGLRTAVAAHLAGSQ